MRYITTINVFHKCVSSECETLFDQIISLKQKERVIPSSLFTHVLYYVTKIPYLIFNFGRWPLQCIVYGTTSQHDTWLKTIKSVKRKNFKKRRKKLMRTRIYLTWSNQLVYFNVERNNTTICEKQYLIIDCLAVTLKTIDVSFIHIHVHFLKLMVS